MNTQLRKDAEQIITSAIKKVLPDEAVSSALSCHNFGPGRIYLVSVGKAAWQMADSASHILGGRISAGIVITKYGHVRGDIPNVTCYEAGHPVPDENSFSATAAVLDMVSDLGTDDTVLFLLSGGGSALFESPLISGEELADITGQLLACGAGIVEINTIRKRLSAVKGGRFARHISPAHIFSIVLSDIIGDPLDMIASGPAYPDSSTCEEALKIIKKYNIKLSDDALSLMETETPKVLNNTETVVTGSVRMLCTAASEACESLGYKSVILTDSLCCEAREAGSFLASIAKTHSLCGVSGADKNNAQSLAFIAGGETVVHITGHGMGGRNQELSLSAAEGISGLYDTAIISAGSDGTDGPTDAAGGYADGYTQDELLAKGIRIYDILQDNDAYHALEACEGLIKTGPTGTNVNDVAVLLIKR